MNSLASKPAIVTVLRLKTPAPVLKIVKVRVILVEPKSVQSVVEGVKSPSTIEIAFPRISISEKMIVATTATLGEEVHGPLLDST